MIKSHSFSIPSLFPNYFIFLYLFLFPLFFSFSFISPILSFLSHLAANLSLTSLSHSPFPCSLLLNKNHTHTHTLQGEIQEKTRGNLSLSISLVFSLIFLSHLSNCGCFRKIRREEEEMRNQDDPSSDFDAHVRYVMCVVLCVLLLCCC